jgi:hypothetical protein
MATQAASSGAASGKRSVGGAVAPVDARLARSVRFWMRAYPRRWRAVRGGELLGLVLDLQAADERRLGARAALDLLRGGWATRWREHPPLHNWLLYRLFDKRIPVAYRAWALDDIDGYWFPVRRFIGSAWIMFVNPLLWSRDLQAARGWWGFVAVFFVGTVFIMPETRRRTARLRHVAARPGELVFEGALVAQDGPRNRATARSALTWAVSFLGTVAVASIICATFAPNGLIVVGGPIVAGPAGTYTVSGDVVVGPVGVWRLVAFAVLSVALAAGALGALVARRRLDRLLEHRIAQPERVLRPVSREGRSAAVFWLLMAAGLAWAETSGRFAFGSSVLLGTVALLMLPGAVIALGATRRVDAPDLAGRDVWWIATRGRVPEVERPVADLWSMPGGYPEGVVVQPRPLGDPSYPALP